MATKFTPAMRELRAVLNEAEALTAGEMSKRDEARVSVLLAKAAALRKDAIAADDFCKRWFKAFLNATELPVEDRTITDGKAGTQSIAWTQGPSGGYLVPVEFADQLFIGMALIDPLLNPAICTVVQRTTNRPYVIPSWDLTTFKSLKKAEAATQTRKDFPTAKNDKIGGADKYTYTAFLAASFELEDDDFQPVIDQFAIGLGIAHARGIGADLAVGDGSTAPQGVVNATDSGVTQAGLGVVTDVDLDNVFYSVNAFYRAQPKCAWLVSDAVHKQIRKAKDSSNRPLINVVNGAEFLLGKPLLICPSLPAYNASLGTQAAGSFCVFGDLSKFVVTVKQPTLRRSLNDGTVGAEYGEALYSSMCSADSKIIDPTGGVTPPIVTARLHS